MNATPQEPLYLVTSQAADFDHFNDHGNEALVAALRAPLPAFTFLQGPSGSGKSHLLKAMESETDHGLRVSATQMRLMPLEQAIPAGVAVVWVDDIDDLQGQREDEVLAFNLFNHCRSHDIKLVFTATCSPRDAAWVLPDLRSRLNSGQLLVLKPLVGQPALAVFSQQLESQGLNLTEDVIQYVTNHWPSDFPTLHHAIQQIITLTLKEKRKVTIPLLKKINL